MRSKLGMAVGVVYLLLGLSMAVSPGWFFSITDWTSRQGLLIAAVMRVVIGIALHLAAPASRYPRVFRVIGTIALVAGLIMLFIPLEFWAEHMQWWMVDNASAFRWILVLAATPFGAFVVYAARPRSPTR
ncbi:MAG: hypothetical protein OEU54_05090 [Gemmatimonadota bacterium]|nr:hypothetical protein [Gemmatimonadota bacterium]